MRTYAQKPKASPQTPAEANRILNLQKAIGNQAEQRLLMTSAHSFPASLPKFDFSRIPLHPTAHSKLEPSRWSDETHTRLYRQAAGPAPAVAPPIVHEVLRGAGQSIPVGTRRDLEELLGYDFADVRIHSDERAGASAEAVAAHAYTVGRHIVFAPGRFDIGSEQGRRLLAHELTHAAGHAIGAPTPTGELLISVPAEAAERHAVAVSESSVAPAVVPATQPRLFRQPGGLVSLQGVTVNHDRVTVPPVAGLRFSATKTPANAPGVTFSVVGDNTTIAAGTTVNNTTGAITVAPAQTGGSAHIEANQNATGPGGATMVSTSPATAPFNFTAIPSGITSTTTSTNAPAGFYGGEFTHTFTSPGGGPAALERSHVNEQFAGASGTTLTITGALTTLTITINNPASAAAGWDLDSAGSMAGPDHVTWSNTTDARKFVANASHPSPSPGLPQALTATQNFRNLIFPNKTYGSAAVASTTHRRAIEDRNNQLKAVTSANAASINQEIVEDYVGPTVFRRCRAVPASIPVAATAPPGKTAPAPTNSMVTVDAEGKPATPTFSVRPPNLGCTITPGGVLTPGSTPGTVTVRAGDIANFDETTVTLTPATPTPNPVSKP
jgi:hypothetical protein